MIERSLEELLRFKIALGYEFNQEGNNNTLNIEIAYENIKHYFQANEQFLKFCNTNNISLENIDEMIMLGIVYAYYYGQDYLLRRKGNREKFGAPYVKTAIPADEIDIAEEVIRFLNNGRNQWGKLNGYKNTLNDWQHNNPMIVKLDSLRNNLKSYQDKEEKNNRENKQDFLGNIYTYFKRIIIDVPDKLFNLSPELLPDLLPGITLAAIESVAYMPMGGKVENGYYKVDIIKRLDNSLNKAIEYHKISNAINSSCPQLLYKMALEDLFYINRLDVTMEQYFEIIKLLELEDTELEKQLLQTIFSVFLRLPSVKFQENCKEAVKHACEAVKDRDVKKAIKHISMIVAIGNIIFPQILIVLLSELFENENNEIRTDAEIESIVKSLEEFMKKNGKAINEHFNIENEDKEQRKRIWDEERRDPVIFYRTESKGKGRKAKDIYELLKASSGSNLNFEDINKYLLAPEPRWRYSTLVEENLPNRQFLDMFKIRRKKFISKTGEYIFLCTSEEYLDVLLSYCLSDLNLADDRINDNMKKLDYEYGFFKLCQ